MVEADQITTTRNTSWRAMNLRLTALLLLQGG